MTYSSRWSMSSSESNNSVISAVDQPILAAASCSISPGVDPGQRYSIIMRISSIRLAKNTGVCRLAQRVPVRPATQGQSLAHWDQQRIDRSLMGRKFESELPKLGLGSLNRENDSRFELRGTAAIATVAGGAVARVCTSTGAVPPWNAVSGRSTSGNTTISSIRNVRLPSTINVGVFTFHRDIVSTSDRPSIPCQCHECRIALLACDSRADDLPIFARPPCTNRLASDKTLS